MSRDGLRVPFPWVLFVMMCCFWGVVYLWFWK